MNRLFWALVTLMVTITALWLAADAAALSTLTFISLRPGLIQYTGLVALALMAAAVFLAVRPRWIETPLRGLDKMYRLHKWLGVAALVYSIAHWMLVKAPGWLVSLGLMQRQARRGRPAGGAPSAAGIEATLRSLRGTAESIGEWTFYAAALLIALALVKAFPYRLFQKTHRVLAAAVLLLVFHAVVLMKTAYWKAPIGWLSATLWLVSAIAAVIVLVRKVGASRKSSATIRAIQRLPESESVSITLEVDERYKGHEPGQFVFVTFAHDGEPHPYTIASAWSSARTLRLVIKALGDHTRKLSEKLAEGQRVTLEGPYGRFTFEGERDQVWIAGGIGVTPFLARLEALANRTTKHSIDLYFCARGADPSLLEELTKRASEANVTLRVLLEGRDGRLDAERLCKDVPAFGGADYWFCGPAGFGEAMLRALAAKGVATKAFHRELFEMR
ncbi:MAG: ferric reductase-like transmembrane domain-containing protein [Polyangiales bacterium]